MAHLDEVITEWLDHRAEVRKEINEEMADELEQLREENARLTSLLAEAQEALQSGVESLDFNGKPKTALGHSIKEWVDKARATLAKIEKGG